MAVVLAVGANELSKETPVLLGPELGIVELYRPSRFVPGSCPVEAICANFPRCLDEGCCQGFEDERIRASRAPSDLVKVCGLVRDGNMQVPSGESTRRA